MNIVLEHLLLKTPQQAYLNGKTENKGYESVQKIMLRMKVCQNQFVPVLKNWFLKKIHNMKKGLGSKAVPVKRYKASVCIHALTDAYTQTEQITNPSYILESRPIKNRQFDN
jgi:hypothetical protein